MTPPCARHRSAAEYARGLQESVIIEFTASALRRTSTLAPDDANGDVNVKTA